MKPRIKMDGLLLAVIVVFSLSIYLIPDIFYKQGLIHDLLDVLGAVLIFKGAFLRMSARGHKVACSPEGSTLVVSGLYAYTRNPMYLGTFVIGLGFILIIWPWWIAFIFAGLFCWRFMPLIKKEEKYLSSIFGQEYANYRDQVPRFFPHFLKALKIDLARECPWHELWLTKERRLLWVLPSIAIVVEYFKEWFLFRHPPNMLPILPFMFAAMILGVIFGIEYFLKNEKITK